MNLPALSLPRLSSFLYFPPSPPPSSLSLSLSLLLLPYLPVAGGCGAFGEQSDFKLKFLRLSSPATSILT